LEAQRKQSWRGSWPLSLTFWYWLLSGYGERQVRALLWLCAILAGFAWAYTYVDTPYGQCNAGDICFRNIREAFVYSLNVMTRQRLHVLPEGGLLQFLVAIEGVIGQLQIALFALAVRRKFMM
jgi:hypothetical protein